MKYTFLVPFFLAVLHLFCSWYIQLSDTCLSVLPCQNHHPNCFNAKDMWHKLGTCPWWTGATLRNTRLSDLSPACVTLLIFSSFFHFLSFPWPSISWLLSPQHFTLSLFICFTLSHRWPFAGSEALCLSVCLSVVIPVSPTFWIPPVLLYLSLSLSQSQVHCLISFILFVYLTLRGQCRVPHLSQCYSSPLRG